jgi:hypothetical protein
LIVRLFGIFVTLAGSLALLAGFLTAALAADRTSDPAFDSAARVGFGSS